MTYTDTYLSGTPAQIDAVIAANPDAPAVIPPVVLDGIAHCCIRTEGAALRLPKSARYAIDDLTQYPETARMAVGGFMADPEPPPAEDAGEIPLPLQAEPKAKKREGKR